ncbi:MAG: carbon-nitrogen hydrolase family protein [Myxococcota bacterium]|nr:carbon-nitrogen hydrolase family protein [Myxococcota bacterium]
MSLESINVAVIQLTCTENTQDNMEKVLRLSKQAIAAGAKLITLPENYGFLGGEEEKLAHAQDIDDGPFIEPLRRLAQAHQVGILAGGLPEKTHTKDKVFNTAVFIAEDGSTLATYRKIHLFDIDLREASFKESSHVAAGDQTVVATFHGWKIGMSICYDLRFPELYRKLVQEGAQILCIPAAFTLHTGKDHWQPLIQCRAIENQAYVAAPAQFGRHSAKRASWGKSMLVDPWGTIIGQAKEAEGFALARFEKSYLDQVRQGLPALSHRRLN